VVNPNAAKENERELDQKNLEVDSRDESGIKVDADILSGTDPEHKEGTKFVVRLRMPDLAVTFGVQNDTLDR
jgi:hypothetical protein